MISIARVPSPVGSQIALWLVAMGSTWNLAQERNPKGSTCATASENALRISTPRKLTGLYLHGTLRASRRRFCRAFPCTSPGPCVRSLYPVCPGRDLYRGLPVLSVCGKIGTAPQGGEMADPRFLRTRSTRPALRTLNFTSRVHVLASPSATKRRKSKTSASIIQTAPASA